MVSGMVKTGGTSIMELRMMRFKIRDSSWICAKKRRTIKSSGLRMYSTERDGLGPTFIRSSERMASIGEAPALGARKIGTPLKSGMDFHGRSVFCCFFPHRQSLPPVAVPHPGFFMLWMAGGRRISELAGHRKSSRPIQPT